MSDDTEKGPIYVGRIGDCDKFITRLKLGIIKLSYFLSPQYRLQYELKCNFKYSEQPDISTDASLIREADMVQKKRYRRFTSIEYPRFNYIGRYVFQKPELFLARDCEQGSRRSTITHTSKRSSSA